MKKRTLLIGAIATATLLAGGLALAQSHDHGHGFGPPFAHGSGPSGPGPTGMGPGMMQQMGRGMMGMNHDPATMGQLSTIHELIVNNDRIKRTVTNLPDGIRTVTESDDPQIAQLIKAHVASMGERVGAGSDPGLPIESPALHKIFRDKDKIQTTYETTVNGVVVVQTSKDADTVAALQQHASEVTDLVQGGMAAVHTAMMKNGGMMHGPMMGSPVAP